MILPEVTHQSQSLPRRALITGGARRIGRRLVERLAAAGYEIAIHCNRSRQDAETLAQSVTASGGVAIAITADLSNPEEVDGLVSRTCSELGPLTALINNAALFEPDDLRSLNRELWDRQIAVNLSAPTFLARDFAAQLPGELSGSIINIIDQRVLHPGPNFFSYTLAKSALWMATRTMAQALAPRIRVNAIGPGPTLQSARQSEDDFCRQSDALPLKRGPDPDEIADAALYLLEAASTTGQFLTVDGGQHLAWRTPDIDGIEE